MFLYCNSVKKSAFIYILIIYKLVNSFFLIKKRKVYVYKWNYLNVFGRLKKKVKVKVIKRKRKRYVLITDLI